MKFVPLLVLISLTLLLLAHDASAAVEQLECAVKTSCASGEVDVLHLSARQNAHAELPTQNNYPLKVCCGGVTGLSNSCTGTSDVFMRLKSQTNSHVGPKSYNAYNVLACLSAQTDVSCAVGTVAPDSSFACIASFQTAGNSHVGECGTYANNVYCSASSYSSNLPPFWTEASGALYPDFALGKSSSVDNYNGRNNVIQVTDDDNSMYGVVSDRTSVSGQGILTASVDVFCEVGIGVLELEYWDRDGARLGSQTAYSTINNRWERIFVSADVPVDTAYTSLLLRSEDPAGEESTCAFDDAYLETSNSIAVDPPDFNGFDASYAGPFACCPQSSCWSGTECVADMAGDPNSLPIRDYRCVGGDWIFSPLLYTWDKSDSGYCPAERQCLVDPDGASDLNGQPEQYMQGNSPQCIDDGQFILDNYCSNGEWQTRTKLIAAEMLDFLDRKNDVVEYTLYCDAPDLTLVDIMYPKATDRILGSQLQLGKSCFSQGLGSCVNQFCVLDYKTQAGDEVHVTGTSLNKEVDDATYSYLVAIDHDENDCNSVTGANFGECDDDTLWYNPDINAVIYSRDGVPLDGDSIGSNLVDTFKIFVQRIKGLFTGAALATPVPIDFTFLDQTSRFERLYVASESGIRINAVQEDIDQKQVIVAEYHNRMLLPDICGYVQNVAREKGITAQLSQVSISCEATADAYHVFTQDPDAVDLWQEFTSKLRIS